MAVPLFEVSESNHWAKLVLVALPHRVEVSRAAAIITNDVRKVLSEGLGTRNSAAHPSDVKIAPSKTISVIEDLVTNVIKKF